MENDDEDYVIEQLLQTQPDTLSNLSPDELLKELHKMRKDSQESSAWFENELNKLRQKTNNTDKSDENI